MWFAEMRSKVRNLSLISILILVSILCLTVFLLHFALFPIDNAHIEDNLAMVPVNGTNPRRATSNSLNHRQSRMVQPRIADVCPTAVTPSIDGTEMLEKENILDAAILPLGLDDVITRNSDGTNTVIDDIELELGEGVVFRIPKGTSIESDGVIRVGEQGVQLVDEAGNIVETFPPGHGIGFSYYDEDTSQESSFDMLGTIKDQQKEKRSPGCNNIDTATLQILMLVLFWVMKQQRKGMKLHVEH
jgi:hypothetical protein